jgi:hypothetical protein
MCKLFLDLKIIIQLIFVGLGFGTQIPKPQSKTGFFIFTSLFPFWGSVWLLHSRVGLGLLELASRFAIFAIGISKINMKRDFKNFVSLTA